MPHRQWRIRAVVLFPKQLVAADPPGPGHLLPARLELLSRVPVEQRDLGTARIAIRPTTHPLLPPREGLEDQFEAAELLVELHAESAFEAIERAHPLLELVLDRLAFDMQIALSVIQTDVTDVTPPIAAGDERDFSTFASYPGDKFARAEDVGSTFAKQVPHLHDSYGEPSPRVRAALRWYIKALGAPLLHDRFIFLWIAVEIFADDSGIEISGALPLRCGHVLKECPECQKPTARKIRGASIRAFLQARGADPDVAKSAWTLRQMLHGAIQFDSEKLAGLAGVVQVLRVIVVAELKRELGLPAESLPMTVSGVTSVHPSMGIEGFSAISEDDLTWPA